MSKYKKWLLPAALAALFFIQVFFGSRHESLTWDEPSFIAAGASYLTTGNFQLNASHPPLMQELVALPLVFLNMKIPSPDYYELAKHYNSAVIYGRQFIFESGNDPLLIAFWSRLPVMFVGTLLVLAIYFWGRQLYGEKVALAGSTLAAFCPNLIAHGKLATEDMGCTVFMFIALWTFWLCFHKESWIYVPLCGVATGLALSSKYTSLLLLPTFATLALLMWIKNREKYSLSKLSGILTVVLAMAIFIVSAFYRFDITQYFSGLQQIYADRYQSPLYYLLGNISNEPWWYYYIVAFFLKTPVPTLIMLGIALSIFAMKKSNLEAGFFLLVPALFVVIVACFDKTNLGLRRILPAFPFLLLFAGQAVAVNVKVMKILVAALIVWLIVDATVIFPHHLSYFNLIAGGPEHGPFLLNDSNIDWGQDLPSLAAWQKHNSDSEPLKLAYFGTAIPEIYGVKSQPMSIDDVENPKPGTYAISVTELVFTGWLSKYKPIGRAGYSIYIFRFD